MRFEFATATEANGVRFDLGVGSELSHDGLGLNDRIFVVSLREDKVAERLSAHGPLSSCDQPHQHP